MYVWTMGLNHQSAGLDLRERFALDRDRVGAALQRLRELVSVPCEAAILSTCNRTELYCAAEVDQTHHTLEWLSELGSIYKTKLMPHLYTWHNDQAARHAFRVASGLDSMVLGETQILGQLKDAVRLAEQQGTMGATLNQLFQRSFAVAKRVRTHTQVGAHSISMAAAAVRLASDLFERLSDTRVLLVGAGEMMELCAVHFNAQQPRAMEIANRTQDRGERLAQRIGAQFMALSDLPDRLHEFDIVISCTASTLPLIGLGTVEAALKRRHHRPMFMLDLAVPRDIEPQVKSLRDVYLYTVDDLATVVQRGKEHRHQAIDQAEGIIGESVASFDLWLSQRQQVALIQDVQNRSDDWHAQQMARAKKMLHKGVPVDEVLELFSRGLRKKMMHPFLHALHSEQSTQRDLAQSSLQRLVLSESGRRGRRTATRA
jgi:glutamyl-tRNA reductase